MTTAVHEEALAASVEVIFEMQVAAIGSTVLDCASSHMQHAYNGVDDMFWAHWYFSEPKASLHLPLWHVR